MAKAPDHIDLRVNIEYARADTTVHACPPGDCGTMPCCDRTPFEVPPTDRMALAPADVTCGKALDLSPAEAAIAVMQAPTSPLSAAEGVAGVRRGPDGSQGLTEAYRGSVWDDWRAALAEALRLNDNPPIWPRGWERQLDALIPVVRHLAAEELRAAADGIAFTPLSQRESGVVTDYTAGMHAAGQIVRLRADALEPQPGRAS